MNKEGKIYCSSWLIVSKMQLVIDIQCRRKLSYKNFNFEKVELIMTSLAPWFPGGKKNILQFLAYRMQLVIQCRRKLSYENSNLEKVELIMTSPVLDPLEGKIYCSSWLTVSKMQLVIQCRRKLSYENSNLEKVELKMTFFAP